MGHTGATSFPGVKQRYSLQTCIIDKEVVQRTTLVRGEKGGRVIPGYARLHTTAEDGCLFSTTAAAPMTGTAGVRRPRHELYRDGTHSDPVRVLSRAAASFMTTTEQGGSPWTDLEVLGAASGLPGPATPASTC